MTDKQAPTGPDGLLREVLGDPEKLNNVFGKEAMENGVTAKFLDAYAGDRARDYEGELLNKLQAGLADMVRENGGGRGPAVDLNVELQNGQPVVAGAVAKGHGAAYNKAAPGARFEQVTKADDRFASMGELCQAIREEARPSRRKDRDALLNKLAKVREFMDSFSSEDPGSGGFLIPEIMRSELLQLALEESIVRSRATVIPMSTLRVPIPTVDETSHATNVFGGIQFYWAEEAASITESAATFGKVVLDAKKLAGFFKVPNELLADAPAFSAFFNTRVPQALAWAEDVAFLTETGAGTPMGVIGSQNPAYVLVDRATTSQLNWADIVNMYARMLPASLKNAVWVASIDVFPQLAQISLSSPGIWMGGYGAPTAQDAPPVTIMGRPVYFTEKVGPANSVGDISFVDLSHYLVGDRQSVEVMASEHAFFQNDQTAYRLVERVDGRPWVQSAITPHNGSSNTLSPYVGLSATHT
jgi:HK97 family phage major capsid protein